MQREFLKNLGIEDKEIIDKILNENSVDIGKAKGEVESLNKQITDLKADVSNKDKEINTLKGQVSDAQELKDKIATLETDNSNLKTQLETEVSKIQKEHETENKVRDAKAKNVKAVLALLDQDKDIDEQLKALQEGEDTSFLFGENLPAGTHKGTPPANGGTPPTSKTLSEAINLALSKN